MTSLLNPHQKWGRATGDPLKIPAATFNTLVDVARDYLEGQRQLGQGATPTARNNCIVLVRNDTEENRERFDVLGISGPVFNPTESLQAFQNDIVLAGSIPAAGTHEGRFAVLLEPINVGAIGRAVIADVVVVRLTVPSEDCPYQYAEIVDESTAALRAVAQGSAALLWREGGADEQWAVVRLGNASPETLGFPGVIVSLEENYTDERYWVKPILLTAASPDPDARLTVATAITEAITVTNLPEVIAGTHVLGNDWPLLVRVFVVKDTDGGTRYVMGESAFYA